jgi:hypothetical protein
LFFFPQTEEAMRPKPKQFSMQEYTDLLRKTTHLDEVGIAVQAAAEARAAIAPTTKHRRAPKRQ